MTVGYLKQRLKLNPKVCLHTGMLQKNVKPQAQLGISCLYDTINKMIVDCSINRWKFSEREQALLHIDNMLEVIGAHPCVIIFDHGYPCAEFFIDLMERQQKFLVRLSATTFKQEQKQMKNDEYLATNLTPEEFSTSESHEEHNLFLSDCLKCFRVEVDRFFSVYCE